MSWSSLCWDMHRWLLVEEEPEKRRLRSVGTLLGQPLVCSCVAHVSLRQLSFAQAIRLQIHQHIGVYFLLPNSVAHSYRSFVHMALDSYQTRPSANTSFQRFSPGTATDFHVELRVPKTWPIFRWVVVDNANLGSRHPFTTDAYLAWLRNRWSGN